MWRAFCLPGHPGSLSRSRHGPHSLQDLEFRHVVERVKLRAPIEGIVGQRVNDLRQKGALYWACCPFHEERTASFAVDPRRGTWRCYGACGEGGDVLSFVQRFDGLTFLDALRLLAREVGEEIDEQKLQGIGGKASREKQDRRERAYELLRWSADFYRDWLKSPDGEPARDYLQARGLSGEISQAFGLGWAPERGNPLLETAQRLRRPIPWLVKLGLIKEDPQSGRAYDFFRGRLLIPIRDRLGRVVGFGGRLLGERKGPDGRPIAKYVNTPETPLFHKGQIIYALDLAMEAARKVKELHLVEGYTDVMAAHQAGFSVTCAVLGTQTTEDHAALVRRSGVKRVVLVFDGDNAGRSAAQKALRGLLPLGIEIRIAELPAGKDPGDLLVSDEGRELYRACIDGARDWFVVSAAGLAQVPGGARAAAVDELFRLLAMLKPVETATRLGELAEALSIPTADVQAQWKGFQDDQVQREQRERLREPQSVLVPQAARPESSPEQATEALHSKNPVDPRKIRAFEQLIGALLLDNSLIPLYANLEEGAPQGELAVIFKAILNLYNADDDDGTFDPLAPSSPAEGDDEAPIDAARVISALGADPARDRVVTLQARAEQADSAENLARDSARWLERTRQDAEVARMFQGLSLTVQSSGFTEIAEDFARSIHEKLRHGRVPEPAAPNPGAPATSEPTPPASSQPNDEYATIPVPIPNPN